MDVKEFVVYTLMRLALFAGTLAIAIGLWSLLGGEVWLPGALVGSFIVSGIGSLVLLNRPRQAFALRVQERAEKATKAFEQIKAREDAQAEALERAEEDDPDPGLRSPERRTDREDR